MTTNDPDGDCRGGAHADGRLSGRPGGRNGTVSSVRRRSVRPSNVPACRPSRSTKCSSAACCRPARARHRRGRRRWRPVCPSSAGRNDGQQDVRLGHEGRHAGARSAARGSSADVVVAGGMESMTQAPYLLDRARAGYRMGHGRVIDHMFLDGLEDAYDKGRLMGSFAEDCAASYSSRARCRTRIAITSLTRAQRAIADGRFAGEDRARHGEATGKARNGDRGRRTAGQGEIRQDRDAQARIPRRRHGDGGEFRSISDGAAALVLMRRSEAERRGLTPLAVDRRPSRHCHKPEPLRHRSYRRDARRCRSGPAGTLRTSTCSRSTKPSPLSRWPRCAISTCRTTRSTSMAARARLVIRSAHRARACW